MIARIPSPSPKPAPEPRVPPLISLLATLVFGLVFLVYACNNKATSSKSAAPSAEVQETAPVVEQPKTEASKPEVKAEVPPPPLRAIVVCCSDHRFCMFKRIRERYGLMEEECFPIIMPGGPDPLANPEVMYDECKAVMNHIDLILGKRIPTIEIIVVAEHQKCACIEHYGFSDPDHGKTDFPAINEYLAQKAPNLKREMLYYSFADREKDIVNPDPEIISVADE